MSSLTLMIVDSNDSFRIALKNALQDSCQVYTSSDGKDALNTAKQLQPDMIILDLMLTGLDGITLLQELQSAGIRPVIMVVTRLNNAYIEQWVDELGIDYLMLKPCDPVTVARRATDLHSRLHKIGTPIADISERTALLLNELSFSPRHLGYQYLKDGIVLMYENPNIVITKELYPEIASRNHASVMMVERSIRSAIQTAWQHRNGQAWSVFFPPQEDGSISRPSNGLFMAKIAGNLRTSGTHNCG